MVKRRAIIQPQLGDEGSPGVRESARSGTISVVKETKE